MPKGQKGSGIDKADRAAVGAQVTKTYKAKVQYALLAASNKRGAIVSESEFVKSAIDEALRSLGVDPDEE